MPKELRDMCFVLLGTNQRTIFNVSSDGLHIFQDNLQTISVQSKERHSKQNKVRCINVLQWSANRINISVDDASLSSGVAVN